jgi:lipoate-protein ligase A
MILWCDGAHDAAENMRRDEALLAAAGAGAEPVLRLFRFTPPGITLGRAQDPARELDLERCRAAGVAWAVRPTGGRAIYHDQEWTYSLAAGLGHPDWGGGLETAYAHVSALLVDSLVQLGVPATLAAGAPSVRRLAGPAELAPRARGAGGRGPGVAPPCFASTARHEIVLEGRKLVGSAQRRTARALLQQGSLLLGRSHLRLVDFLALPDTSRQRVRDELGRAATDAGAWLGSAAPLERWAGALAASLPAGTLRVDGDAGRALLAAAPPAGATG